MLRYLSDLEWFDPPTEEAVCATNYRPTERPGTLVTDRRSGRATLVTDRRSGRGHWATLVAPGYQRIDAIFSFAAPLVATLVLGYTVVSIK